MSARMEDASLPHAADKSAAGLPPAPLAEGVLCPDCGYDLRGSTSARCPECGFALDVLRTAASQIPWSYRHELGRFRAYWKTVWLVIRWPKRFCIEMARPVSYADAQSFRWVTLLHVYLSILVGSVGWVVFDYIRGLQGGALMWCVLGGLQLVALGLFAALPGLASYFFQSRRLSIDAQNRAIALSYYAWAPLATLPWVLPFWLATLVCWSPQGFYYAALPAVGAVIAAYAVFLSERRVLRIAQYTLHRSWTAALLRVVLLNILALLLGLFLALLPLSIYWLLIVWDSLR